VLAHAVLAFSKVDAKGVVRGDVGLHPLHGPGKFGDGCIGGRGEILYWAAVRLPTPGM
jgi:hypothetical protein